MPGSAPTGALSVYPEINIDKSKCIHCHNCLNFHEHGCIVADSLVKSMENKTKVTFENINLLKAFLQEGKFSAVIGNIRDLK